MLILTMWLELKILGPVNKMVKATKNVAASKMVSLMVTHSQLAGVGRLESLLLQSPPEVSFEKARVCRRVFRGFFLHETHFARNLSLRGFIGLCLLGLKGLRIGSVIKFTIGVPESSKGVKFDDICTP